MSDQQTPTMEEDSVKTDKDDVLRKLRKDCSKWPQLSKTKLNFSQYQENQKVDFVVD